MWKEPFKFALWLEVKAEAKHYREALLAVKSLPTHDGIKHSCHAAVSRKAHAAWRKYMDEHNGNSSNAG